MTSDEEDFENFTNETKTSVKLGMWVSYNVCILKCFRILVSATQNAARGGALHALE